MYIKKLLSTSGVAAGAIDLAGNPLPLRDDEVWRGSPRWQAIWSPVALQLRAPVGLRCRRTRMGGHGSQRVQELLLLCGNQELGHKPALIVAISASGNGVYPVAELTMASGKNHHVVYIPDHVIVRNVNSVCNAEPCLGEQAIRDRLAYSLQTLCADALTRATLRH